MCQQIVIDIDALHDPDECDRRMQIIQEAFQTHGASLGQNWDLNYPLTALEEVRTLRALARSLRVGSCPMQGISPCAFRRGVYP